MFTLTPGSFTWNNQTERAAELVAEGELSNIAIANQLEITRQTLWNWRNHPDFQERVESILSEFRSESIRMSISVRERRVAAMIDRHQRMTRKIKALGDGFDRHLYKSLLEHEKQMAQELGQWEETSNVNVTGLEAAGKPDDVAALMAAARKLKSDANRSRDLPEHEADRS